MIEFQKLIVIWLMIFWIQFENRIDLFNSAQSYKTDYNNKWFLKGDLWFQQIPIMYFVISPTISYLMVFMNEQFEDFLYHQDKHSQKFLSIIQTFSFYWTLDYTLIITHVNTVILKYVAKSNMNQMRNICLHHEYWWIISRIILFIKVKFRMNIHEIVQSYYMNISIDNKSITKLKNKSYEIYFKIQIHENRTIYSSH